MMFDFLDFSDRVLYQLGADAFIAVLLLVLIISFRSRGRVFCQYLKIMTGIELQHAQVKMLYKSRGKAGVRDLLIDLIIQKDLADPARLVTPGSTPKPNIYDSGVFED